MEKNIIVEGHNLKIKIIDKKLKNTLVCIHGFSSNKEFIGELDKHIDNFNIVSISYDEINILNLKTIKNVLLNIFNKRIKHTKLYILAHSLGGYFASEIAKSKKIKGVYFLNPIHPYFLDTNKFRFYQKLSLSKSKLGKSGINLIIKIVGSQNSKMIKFINPKSKWFNIVIDLVKESKNFQKSLEKNFKLIKNKSIFIISKKDDVISSTKLKKFLEEKDFKYHQIDYIGHSPLLKNSEIIVPYLLNIKLKHRWFFKKIVK